MYENHSIKVLIDTIGRLQKELDNRGSGQGGLLGHLMGQHFQQTDEKEIAQLRISCGAWKNAASELLRMYGRSSKLSMAEKQKYKKQVETLHQVKFDVGVLDGL